jgi:hypothetical protein
MSRTCIQVKAASIQYLSYYPKRAGSKHAIPTTLPNVLNSKYVIPTILSKTCPALVPMTVYKIVVINSEPNDPLR